MPEKPTDASASPAVDWTDLQTFSRPPPAKGGPRAGPGASGGHRKNNLLRSQDELYWGCCLSPLVQDLHPHDRGPKGSHDGAIISNGNLYCPCTPRPMLELGPLARTATKEQAADHDRKTAELSNRNESTSVMRDPTTGVRLCATPR